MLSYKTLKAVNKIVITYKHVFHDNSYTHLHISNHVVRINNIMGMLSFGVYNDSKVKKKMFLL